MFDVYIKEVYTVLTGTFPVRVVAVGRWRRRWFNRDYRSRKKCLSCDPHGGGESSSHNSRKLYQSSGSGWEGDAGCCWHWNDWWWLVVRRHRGHGAITDGLIALFSPSCCSRREQMIHWFILWANSTLSHFRSYRISLLLRRVQGHRVNEWVLCVALTSLSSQENLHQPSQQMPKSDKYLRLRGKTLFNGSINYECCLSGASGEEWVNKMLGLNTRGCCSFPLSNQNTTLCWVERHDRSLTLTKWLF